MTETLSLSPKQIENIKGKIEWANKMESAARSHQNPGWSELADSWKEYRYRLLEKLNQNSSTSNP
jgi:hypothetical protein